jgi:hypothetical protein
VVEPPVFCSTPMFAMRQDLAFCSGHPTKDFGSRKEIEIECD